MKRFGYKIGYLWFAGIFILLTINSCIYDNYEEVSLLISEGDGNLILRLNPGVDNNGTVIETLDVISFYVNDAGEHFLYTTTESTLKEDNGENKRFEVAIQQYGGVRQRLVLIANARARVRALGHIAIGTPKEEVLARLEFDFPPIATDDPDNTLSPLLIPMWGKSTPVVLSEEVTELSHPVDMIRAVLRMEVTVADIAQSDFILKEIYLYNPCHRGRVTPADSVWDGSQLKVTAASLPADPNRQTAYPVTYETISTDGIGSDEAVYMVENASTLVPGEATCLVIGGVYTGDSNTTYYRLDFWQAYRRGFRSLLRNHHYRFNITGVGESGYGTPDEAFEGDWKQIEVEITGWNLMEVEWEDPESYRLEVSPGKFHYIKDGGTGTLSILSKYINNENPDPDIWTGTLSYMSGGSDWINFSDGTTSWQKTGDAGDKYSYPFTVGTYTVGNPWYRHAQFKIQAGNLVKYVDVYQTNEVWYGGGTDEIFDWTESDQSANEIDGPYRLGTSQSLFEGLMKNDAEHSFDISTDYKDGYQAKAETEDGGNWLTILSGESFPGPGNETLTFRVEHNDTHTDRNGMIIIQAGSLIKHVHVKQITWINDGDGLGTDQDWEESDQSVSDLDGWYSLEVEQADYEYSGEAHEGIIIMTTNGEGTWTAAVETGNSWLSLTGTTTGTAENGPETLAFRVEANNSGASRTGTIRIHLVHNGNRIKKDIKVTQHLGMVEVEYVYPTGRSRYITDQFERQWLIVKSRTAWEIEVEEDNDNILRTLHTTGGAANRDSIDEEEQRVYFVLNTIADGAGPYELRFRIKSITGSYQPVTVILHAEER